MDKFANKAILVPVDLAEVSERTLEYALELASSPELVTVLHVAVPVLATDPAVMYMIDEELRRREIAQYVRTRFGNDKYRGVRTAVDFGDPGERITTFAKDNGIGLIVMPSHGRTGLPHLLIGSVAERVVRYAPCPVLVLRGMSDANKASA